MTDFMGQQDWVAIFIDYSNYLLGSMNAQWTDKTSKPKTRDWYQARENPDMNPVQGRSKHKTRENMQ